MRDLTVAFADVSGFTRLTDAQGDVAALAIAIRLEEAARHALRGRARLVKRVGDAVMLAALQPGEAVATAVALRQFLATDTDFPPLSIGLHYGSAVISDGDIVGAAVNLASHLTDQAAPGAILCTEPVARVLRAEHGVVAVERGSDRLGGLHEVGIYELVAA